MQLVLLHIEVHEIIYCFYSDIKNYIQMQSYFGANVLHPRTIIPVMRYNIPIVIRNIFNLSAPGTVICHPSVREEEDPQNLESYVKGFATIDNLALINVEG